MRGSRWDEEINPHWLRLRANPGGSPLASASAGKTAGTCPSKQWCDHWKEGCWERGRIETILKTSKEFCLASVLWCLLRHGVVPVLPGELCLSAPVLAPATKINTMLIPWALGFAASIHFLPVFPHYPEHNLYQWAQTHVLVSRHSVLTWIVW